MTVVNEILIPRTVYGTASGFYDGSTPDWVDAARKAVNYYRGRGHLETVWINVRDFKGVITIEANLDLEPGTPELDDYATSLAWIKVATFGDASSIVTDYHPIVIAGNYTWLRARVEGFENGVIEAVTLTY